MSLKSRLPRSRLPDTRNNWVLAAAIVAGGLMLFAARTLPVAEDYAQAADCGPGAYPIRNIGGGATGQCRSVRALRFSALIK